MQHKTPKKRCQGAGVSSFSNKQHSCPRATQTSQREEKCPARPPHPPIISDLATPDLSLLYARWSRPMDLLIGSPEGGRITSLFLAFSWPTSPQAEAGDGLASGVRVHGVCMALQCLAPEFGSHK